MVQCSRADAVRFMPMSDQELRAVAPPSPPGTRDMYTIVVENNCGSYDLADAWTWWSDAVPDATSLAPTSGSSLGGGTLTITGTNLDAVDEIDVPPNVLLRNRDFRVMSAHTLSDDPALMQVSVRRLLILLRKMAVKRGMDLVFENNHKRLREVTRTVNNVRASQEAMATVRELRTSICP